MIQSVDLPDGVAQAEVIHRQHIRPIQYKHQKHLRGPPPDAMHPDQSVDHFGVAHGRQTACRDLARDKMVGQVSQIFDFLP